jgi:hypothetical protein
LDGREHRRVRLRLKARVRWSAPLGQATELTETLDISRGGLLIHIASEHALGARVWVAFPYDSLLGENQPEIAARVVRVEPNGGSSQKLALQLLEHSSRPPATEKRTEPRLAIAFPVAVRPSYAPWPEEAMTVDTSASGLRFLTSREYACGETLRIKFGAVAPAEWPPEQELPARVVRVAMLSNRVSIEVAVQRERARE